MTPDGSLFDPDAAVLANAAQWIEGTLLGSVAAALCIVAVAVLGMMMLSGRIPVREGMRVLLGCFLLLGAPAIAAGLMHSATTGPLVVISPQSAPLPPLPKAPAPVPYDPYAGASVPRQ